MSDFNEKYNPLSLEDRIRAMHSIRQQMDALDEELSNLQREHDFLSKVAVPQSMEDSGVELIRIAGVGRVNLRGDLHASIVAGKKDEAFEWLVKNGRGGLITETVNASSLKASIKDAMKNGEEFPPDIFKISPYSKAVITKA